LLILRLPSPSAGGFLKYFVRGKTQRFEDRPELDPQEAPLDEAMMQR
jgi:hypothetical protein